MAKTCEVRLELHSTKCISCCSDCIADMNPALCDLLERNFGCDDCIWICDDAELVNESR
jgi:hypothetical protein